MTADDAGVNVRERLAQLVQEYADIVDSEVPFIDNPLEIADAILAAGFGDVAEAKASAWDEGYEAGSADESFSERGSIGDPNAADHPHDNPYRTTDTNGASE